MITTTLLRNPFLRILMSFAVGIVFGDALFFYEHTQWRIDATTAPSELLLILSSHYTLPALFFYLLAIHLVTNRYYTHYICGISFYLCLIVMGASFSTARLMSTNLHFSNHEEAYCVIIKEKPQEKEKSVMCHVALEAKVDSLSITPHKGNHTLLLYLQKDSASATLKQGDRLLVYTRIAPPANNGNPEEFDYVRYLIRKGGSATAYVPSLHWRVMNGNHPPTLTLAQVANDCREEVVMLYRGLNFTDDNLAVLSALTIGSKENLSDDVKETYSVAGASHVLALSGLHIGFLYALLLIIVSTISRRSRRFKPIGLALIIAALWAFAFVTGLSPSVVRSVIMCSLVAVASLQPEKTLPINILASTAFLMLVYNPLWLFDVGFQLSFVAVLSILLLQPRLYSLLQVNNRLLRYVWGLLTVSVAAQVGTAPLVIYYFSRFSTHFLLTNLWVIPMVTLVLYLAVVMLLLTPLPVVQQWLAGVIDALLDAQNAGLRWIEQLPASSIDRLCTNVWEILLFYLLLYLIYRFFKMPRARNLYFALFCLFVLVLSRSVTVFTNLPRRSINFYNVSNCPAVHCIAGWGESWLACADSMPAVHKVQYSLSHKWNLQQLQAPHIVTSDLSSPHFSCYNNIVYYAGKCICMINDDRWNGKEAANPLMVDYIYVAKGYKGDIAELTYVFKIKTVILDSSLSDYRTNIIKKECIRLSIPCISIKDRGALTIEL